MKIFLGVLALVAVASAAIGAAPYEVVRTESDYELRTYPRTKWVSTSMDAYMYNEVQGELFNRLFKYIDGGNDRAEAIPMTAPVTTHVFAGEGPNCVQTFTMAFYIPDFLQADPPMPTDANVSIEDRAEFQLYARRFTGYAQDDDWIMEGVALQSSLVRDGVTDAQYMPWYLVGYNSPYDFVDRRNEVWFPVIAAPAQH